MKTRGLQRVKAALVKELDVTLQHCYHQRLNDVITDMRIHYADIKPNASPEEVISIFLQNGVLKTMSAAPIVQLRESLERLQLGTFGLCTVCGRKISARYLEQNPTTKYCNSCSKVSEKIIFPKRGS